MRYITSRNVSNKYVFNIHIYLAINFDIILLLGTRPSCLLASTPYSLYLASEQDIVLLSCL